MTSYEFMITMYVMAGLCIAVTIVKAIWFPDPTIESATCDAEMVLTVHYSNDRVKKYWWSGKEWHHWPYMDKVDSDETGELDQIMRYLKFHGNPYPTAHLKQAN